MDFYNQGMITNQEARSKDTAGALMAGDKGPSAMDEDKETYHGPNTSVSPAIRTDL
jgi:hypothetical protein